MKPQKREIKELIPFTIAPKIIRYIGINLTKEVKDLYTENYRILLKETEEDTKKQKNISSSWIGKTNIDKMSTLPKVICRFSAIFNNILIVLFTEIEQTILKFVWNYKRPQITKAILRKKNKTRRIMPSDFKVYCKAMVIKTVSYQHKNRY